MPMKVTDLIMAHLPNDRWHSAKVVAEYYNVTTSFARSCLNSMYSGGVAERRKIRRRFFYKSKQERLL